MDKLIKLLKAEIAGSFDLFNTTTIYKGVDENLGNTHIHEQSHLKIISSTSFGHVQRVLAYLNKSNDGGHTHNVIESIDEKLFRTLRVSLLAHEGYAVWREIELGNLFGLESDSERLPELYKRAYDYYCDIERALAGPDSLFKIEIARGIAECCFNTNILNELAFDCFESSFESNISKQENQPDYRLRVLLDTLAAGPLLLDLDARLKGAFSRLSTELGYSKYFSLEGLHLALNLRPFDFVPLFEQWDKIVTGLIHDAFKSLSLPFEFGNPLNAQDAIVDFQRRLTTFLAPKGIEMFQVLERKGYVDCMSYQENIEYVPPRVFEKLNVYLDEQNISAISDTFSNNNYCFIAEMGVFSDHIDLKSKPDKSFVTLTELTCIDNYSHQNERKILKVQEEQICFFGDNTIIKKVIEKLKNRAVVFLIEWGSAMQSRFIISEQLLKQANELQLNAYILSQTSISALFIAQIKFCNDVGVKEGYILNSIEEFTYFVLKLKNNVTVILKCTIAYFNILKIHKVPEFSLLEDFLQFDKNSIEYATIELLVKLDLMGAFFHHEVRDNVPL